MILQVFNHNRQPTAGIPPNVSAILELLEVPWTRISFNARPCLIWQPKSHTLEQQRAQIENKAQCVQDSGISILFIYSRLETIYKNKYAPAVSVVSVVYAEFTGKVIHPTLTH